MEAEDLVHVHQDVYNLKCNWKVFNDNYLVGPLCSNLLLASQPHNQATMPCLLTTAAS